MHRCRTVDVLWRQQRAMAHSSTDHNKEGRSNMHCGLAPFAYSTPQGIQVKFTLCCSFLCCIWCVCVCACWARVNLLLWFSIYIVIPDKLLKSTSSIFHRSLYVSIVWCWFSLFALFFFLFLHYITCTSLRWCHYWSGRWCRAIRVYASLCPHTRCFLIYINFFTVLLTERGTKGPTHLMCLKLDFVFWECELMFWCWKNHAAQGR